VTRSQVDFTTLDLDNWHREPIHVPGYIQPHGMLFALDLQGRLTHASWNVRAVLSGLPLLGASWPVSPSGCMRACGRQ
jgi:light-regulated signal transduction histidine kinase (bacteriophytochrome)